MQHPNLINSNNCLILGPTPIGSKTKNMGNDVFDNVTLKLKNTPEAKLLIEETEKYLKQQFKSIFEGSMQGLQACPPKYDFGVESKKGDWARNQRRAMQFVDEKLIKNRIQLLDQKSNPTIEDLREKSHLSQVMQAKLPMSTEAKVILRFQNFFAKDRGLLLHSYKPASYLQRYIELAKDLRQNNNDTQKYNPPNLTTLEKDILNILNITFNDVDQWVLSSMNRIQMKKSCVSNFFSGRLIQAALALNATPKNERKNQWNELKRAFSPFQTENGVAKKDALGNPITALYDKDDIQRKLYQSEFKRLTQEFNDEFDLLVILLDHQLIIGTEIKHATKQDKNTNDRQTKEAAKQTKKRKAYVEKTFGDLLEQGWNYVEVIAIYDNIGNLVVKKCTDCSPFILTNGNPQEEEYQMLSLMTSLTTNRIETSTSPSRNQIAFESFKHLFARIIGLSGSLMTVQKISPHHEIMGSDAKDLNAGWTLASPLKYGPQDSVPREGDVFGRPHDVYKLIFFTPDQIGLLNMSSKFVVFLNDYGSGKVKFVLQLKNILFQLLNYLL